MTEIGRSIEVVGWWDSKLIIRYTGLDGEKQKMRR
jgi:hypothetical protein